jgi:thioester reductase-like protein
MNSSTQTILLTGATGTIGSHLVPIYLAQENCRLTLLVRDKGKLRGSARIAKMIGFPSEESLPAERLEILIGDVSEPRFGLDSSVYDRLLASTDLVIHGAATTKLTDSEENCHRINLRGTANVLDFSRKAANAGRLTRLSHISTAYVAGSRLGIPLIEDELPENPVFANNYERSKYAAEVLVRQQMSQGLPVTIYRPSIVVGDSVTGRPVSFNVSYPFFRILASGMLSQIPVHSDSCLNMVPVDFVAHSIASINHLPMSLGNTYHLVSKIPTPMRMFQELEQFYPHLSHIFRRVELVDPEQFDPANLPEDEQLLYQGLEAYLPYLEDHMTLDTRNMDAILPAIGMEWPDTGMPFIRRLFEYVIGVGYFSSDL